MGPWRGPTVPLRAHATPCYAGRMTAVRRAPRFAGLALAACLAAGLPSLGCRGLPKASWDGRTVASGALLVDLPAVPTTWRRVELAGAMLAFAPPEGRQVVLVNGRCGLANDDVPLTSLTQQLLAGTTSRAFLREERIPFDGREALRAFVVAKLDGVPRFFDLLVFKKNGCIVDLVRTGPPGDEANGSDVFDGVVASFHLRAPEHP